MPSLQSYLLKQLMRRARQRALPYLDDIKRVRLAKERLMGRLQPPREIHTLPFALGDMKAAWFSTTNATPTPATHPRVILYSHGGGYAAGSLNTHKALTGKLAAELRQPVLAYNYRLAPEHPFPAALDDAISAYRYLLEQGYQPQHILFCGDSAGGGLTLALLLAARDSGLPLPGAAVLLSPWTDLACTGGTIMSKRDEDPFLLADRLLQWATWYAGSAGLQHPLVSPLYANLRGLPPLFVQVGTAELLLDDSLRLVEQARAHQVPTTLDVWPHMPHVQAMSWQYLPEGRKGIRRIADWVAALSSATALHPAPVETTGSRGPVIT